MNSQRNWLSNFQSIIQFVSLIDSYYLMVTNQEQW